MTRILVFFLILVFSSIQGWLLDNTSLDAPLRILSFAGDIVMLALAVTSLRRNASFYGWWALFAFLFVSTLTLVYNIDRTGIAGHFNGLRLPLAFFSFLLVTYDFMRSEYRERFEKYFTVFLILFAIAQIPTSFIQFREHGPSDFVGGTLGWAATNVVTLALFLIVFYLIVRYGSSDDRSHYNLLVIVICSLLLFPCAINETKISFVLLPLLVVLLTLTKRVYVAIPALLLGIGALLVLNNLYSEYQKDTSHFLNEGFFERYLLYDASNPSDLPRGQKIVLTWDLMAGDPVTYVIGMGYGLFMGSHLLKSTAFGFSFDYLAGARMFLNTVWLQGGLLAVICLAYPLFHFVGSGRITSPNMKRFKWFLFVVLFVMWLYHDSLFNRAFAAITSYLILWTEEGGIDRVALEQLDDDTADEFMENGVLQ